MKCVSAVDLVDKSVVCPKCAKTAVLRRDLEGYWIDCPSKHRPVVNILGETSLQVVEAEAETAKAVKS